MSEKIDIPRGYRHTEENTVYIHPFTYDLIKPMSATGMLVELGSMREVGDSSLSWRTIEIAPGVYNWMVLDEAIERLNALGIMSDTE